MLSRDSSASSSSSSSSSPRNSSFVDRRSQSAAPSHIRRPSRFNRGHFRQPSRPQESSPPKSKPNKSDNTAKPSTTRASITRPSPSTFRPPFRLGAPSIPTSFTSPSIQRFPLRSRPGSNFTQTAFSRHQNAPSLTAQAQAQAQAKPTTRPVTSTSAVIISSARAATAEKAIPKPSMPPGGDTRPRQPQLSAAAAKSLSRPPLTPKVATTKAPTAVTPLGRRTHNQTAPPLAGQTSPFKEDAPSTPVSAFLANNVTPRSGARQIRVDSANSTPSGTPNPERTSDGWDGSRIGTAVSQVEAPVESAESKFFYASDARSQPSLPTQRPVSVPPKSGTFFYASGAPTATEGKRTTSPPSNTPFTPVLGSVPDPIATKFFYANGTPDVLPTLKPGVPASGSASTVSSAPRLPNARPSTGNSAVGHAPMSLSRPGSPIKAASTPLTNPLLAGTSIQPEAAKRPQGSSPPSQAASSTTNQAAKRRVSIDVSPKMGRAHARTISIPKIDPTAMPRLASPPQIISEPASPLSTPGLSHPAMTMASILQAVEDMGEDQDEDSPAPQSPTKSTHSSDAVSELVANARRERKVQDLEITNASLEAINRTLERQLRKQTAELRRYRRLSRSGRLSIASVASSRVTSAAMTEPPSDLSDLSEEEDEEETDDDDYDSLDNSLDMSTTTEGSTAAGDSPSAKALSRRKRDEKRLQLDLTKHQELLVDSQKMNQSLKRCLNWTEVLIKEGQKALEYNVRVSDVELGGRVLVPVDEDEESRVEEDDDERGSGDDLLEPPAGKTVPDRDSGIEMPVDGG